MVSLSLVSKARRPKFNLTLKIIDLNNIPLVSGTSHVKWHLPSSITAEHRGRTEKSFIKDHIVSWDYTRPIPVRLTMDKANNLQECLINFEVVQDYSSGGRGDKITLGHVSLNLAEYVEESEHVGPDGDVGVTRRYLMQDSKINSTLKIGISMQFMEGERNYVAPPLRTAQVFGGIAGVIVGDQTEQDDLGNLPPIKFSRDAIEFQDLYRQALASSWKAKEEELPADECIENIFAGGDGWSEKLETVVAPRAAYDDSASGSGEEKRQHVNPQHNRTPSGASTKSQSTVTARNPNRRKNNDSRETLNHTHFIDMSLDDTASMGSERGRTGFKKAQEVDEFNVRDDLVAWRLPDGYST